MSTKTQFEECYADRFVSILQDFKQYVRIITKPAFEKMCNTAELRKCGLETIDSFEDKSQNIENKYMHCKSIYAQAAQIGYTFDDKMKMDCEYKFFAGV